MSSPVSPSTPPPRSRPESRADRRRFYTTARGSATECAAVLDLLKVRGLAQTDECAKARALVVRIVQMLTKFDRSLAT